ncbi:MAG TPA: ATP-binding protein [Candidatus Binatia bacterium]|nr:ATP-binding protein [Candidatus Binatia bacterium]
MKSPNDPDARQELALLSFAIRLILADLDHRLLIERGLESFADFGRCDKVAIFLLDPSGETLTVGGCIGSKPGDTLISFPIAGTPFEEVLGSKQSGQFQLKHLAGAPCPSYDSGQPGRQCLCVPLVEANNRALGAVAFDQPARASLDSTAMQCLLILQSVLAISIENARALARLQQAHDELQTLNQAKTKMINHLSHELKTPLAIISASAKILTRPSVGRDEQRWSSALERMERSIGRLIELEAEANDIAQHRDLRAKNLLATMIRQCRDLLEATADEGEAPKSLYERLTHRLEEIFSSLRDNQVASIVLGQWVPEVLAAMEPLYRHRNVRLELDLCQSPAVCMPEAPLRKVFSGLVRNAIENTPDGGLIRVELDRRSDALCLRVRDYGIGIKEEEKKQLFHGFVHTGDTQDYSSGRPFDFRAGGKGLDLLRSKLFSEQFGFDIQVESEYGAGSIFTLEFPPDMLGSAPKKAS